MSKVNRCIIATLRGDPCLAATPHCGVLKKLKASLCYYDVNNLMSSCCGDGKCLESRECHCVCMNVIHTCDCGHQHICTNACTCGHKAHNGYCPDSDCDFDCAARMCWNWQICNEYAPQYVLTENNNMTPHCAKLFGRITFLDKKDYCHICSSKTLHIQLECGHIYCKGCFKVDIMINRNWDTLEQCINECKPYGSRLK